MASTDQDSTPTRDGWSLIPNLGPGRASHPGRATLRVTPTGRSCLTAQSFELLGRPVTLRFYGNGTPGALAVEPLNHADPNGIKTSPNGSGGASFSALRAFRMLGIPKATTLFFVRQENGLFILALRHMWLTPSLLRGMMTSTKAVETASLGVG